MSTNELEQLVEDGTWKVAHRHADPVTVPQSAESVIQN